ncbi:MAG: fumarate hydratase C-terminal domain-containing protein [Oscillospiraceae bacterium]
MKELCTPFTEADIAELNVGDMVYVSGYIFCGRDAVLPKIVEAVKSGTLDSGIDLKGNVIFHTAVSPAGVGPTSSNKLEIESSMIPLSEYAGIKMHLGKGKIKEETVQALAQANAVYAVIPPVTALLESKTSERVCVAHPELGMEALYRVKVDHYPVIIAAAKGRSIY